MRQGDDGASAGHQRIAIERAQVGARMEKRMVKVLKGLAEYLDLSLGDLLEGIVLHAFAGQAPFDDETLARIAQLKQVYGMDYGAEASHRLVERAAAQRPARTARKSAAHATQPTKAAE